MRSFVVFSISIACALVACSDDDADDSDWTSGSDASGSGSGSTSSSSGGAQGVPCAGGFCGQNEYCGFADGVCGETDPAPACQPFPPCQPESVACDCDNLSYDSGCDAADATGGIRNEGACMPPEGKFTCTYEYQAPIYCEIGVEYCHVQIAPSGDYPLECLPVPAACVPGPDCSCVGCDINYCAGSEDLQEMTVYCN
jgi:hypothetical protein